VEIRQLSSADAVLLGELFEMLRARGIDDVFHPHPLTEEAARARAGYRGKDLYFLLCRENHALGYGMLRGWDEGYDTPSLGIVIHPDVQGQGLGRLLMEFLHVAARRRGARKIRLRVHSKNHRAISLYQSLGYELNPDDTAPYLVGLLDLTVE
jgi:ribosomal protein S18 acetylase RimI-like enzyme